MSRHSLLLMMLLALAPAGHAWAVYPGSIVAWGYNPSVPPPNNGFIAISAGKNHILGLVYDGSITAWGQNGSGQCNVPSPNSGFTAVAAGGYHSLALKSNGSVVAWGYNYYGQANIPSPNTGFVAIAAGYYHNLALKSDGSIVAWGSNVYGQCSVPSPNSGFVAIAAGHDHSVGLKSDGSIVVWGDNTYNKRSVPTPNSGFTAIGSGCMAYHCLGLKSDGSVVAWGYNQYGQCNVPAPNSGFTALATGTTHSLGLKSDGTVVAWGTNGWGERNVPEPNSGFAAVAAGDVQSLGLRPGSSPIPPPQFSPAGGTYNSEQTVTVTGASGAAIHYTRDGVDPTESDPVIPSGGTVLVDRSLTLKARAWLGSDSSSVASAGYNLVVATPVLSPGNLSQFTSDVNITVTCTTPGATLHYTVDGNDPTEADPVVTGGMVFADHNLTLKVKGWKTGFSTSQTASAVYYFCVATPAIAPGTGTYNSEQTATITCSTPGSVIHYTTDGLAPTESDPVIASGGTVFIDHSMTIKAAGWRPGYSSSGTNTAAYHLGVATPVFTPNGRAANREQMVFIGCATPGAVIHYTTNGADPSESDPVVGPEGSILVDHSLTLKAAGWKAGFDPSAVHSADYSLVVATPAVNPEGGMFASDQSVLVTCATPEAAIHYTLNGADPTEADPVVASGGSLLVSPTMTLKLQAFKAGLTPSAIRTCVYSYGATTVYHVRPTGSDANSGLEWETAKATVQSAIDAASSGDEVWVSQGTYVCRITLKDGVALYGGFAGSETDRNARDWKTHRTILDGNTSGSVVTSPVGAMPGTRIDGFTIRNGSGSNEGSVWNAFGGGIYCKNSSPTITNNLITGNYLYALAEAGGAIYCVSSSAVITGNTIIGNTISYEGASSSGAGIYCAESATTIVGNTISENRAYGSYVWGGGIYSTGADVISGNTITVNEASGSDSRAGGVYCSGSALVWGNTIRENTAPVGGGVVIGGQVSLVNNLIRRNTATSGGGIYLDDVWYNGVAPWVTNNTIVQNTASQGGGIYSGNTQIPSPISNNIIALNNSGIYASSEALMLSHNCVQGNASYDYSGIADPTGSSGNMLSDPLFVDMLHGNFRLQPASPCVNAGTETALDIPDTDLDGSPRIIGGMVDIGCYESDGTSGVRPYTIVRVSTGGDDTNSGASWDVPMRTIQAAIDKAWPLDGEVWVKGGVYAEHVLLRPFTQVFGGFSGGETARSERDRSANETVIDGSGSGNVVTSTSGYHVSVLDGFTIRNGDTGFYCTDSSPTITNNVVTANQRGIACDGGAGPLIAYNDIAYNGTDTVFGASGIYCSGASPTIMCNRIRNNNGAWSGGLDIVSSSPVVTGNIITGNAGAFASAVRLQFSDPVMTNNTIAGNTFALDGSPAISCVGTSAPVLSNNIIAYNHGVGVSAAVTSAPSLKNNCVYGNSAGNYSGTADPTGANGNISVDPLLADPPGDCHITAASPCVNAGWNGASNLASTDMDSQARIIGGTVDIGADEYFLQEAVAVKDAKLLVNGMQVHIQGALVSAAWTDCFYVESDDRTSGIRVEKTAHGLTRGMRTDITGLLQTNADGERYIQATTLTPDTTMLSLTELRPLGLTGRSLGGGSLDFDPSDGSGQEGVEGGSGLNNIGLLVRIWGHIAERDSATPPSWLRLDDGSGVITKVMIPDGVIVDPAWDCVGITGVSSCERTGGVLHSVLRLRDRNDIAAF